MQGTPKWRTVERCAQARALFDQQAGIVAVDVEDTGDPPLVVVAIAGVRWHWLRRRRMHCRILLLGNNAHCSMSDEWSQHDLHTSYPGSVSSALRIVLRGSNVTHLFFLLLLHILTYRETA